jgi:hypothetical protein
VGWPVGGGTPTEEVSRLRLELSEKWGVLWQKSKTERLPQQTGAGSQETFPSGRGRNIFLDIPLYRSGDCAQNGS